MIVRSDVSVYQIFRRFRLRKPEFPGRWIAKPLSYLPILLPFLLFLTPFSFPSISCFFLLHLKVFLFALFLSLSHVYFFFSLPFPWKLVSCFQFCAGLRKGSAKQHSFVSSTLSLASSKLSYPELPQLFFLLHHPSILLFCLSTADRRETYSVSVSSASAWSSTSNSVIEQTQWLLFNWFIYNLFFKLTSLLIFLIIRICIFSWQVNSTFWKN